VFQVAKAQAGEAEFGSLTACANHVEIPYEHDGAKSRVPRKSYCCGINSVVV
jgi:hypothetical protein